MGEIDALLQNAKLQGELRVTQLERHEPEGRRPYYTANVSHKGHTESFHTRNGSWMTEPNGEIMREALPAVAEVLQDRVHRVERRQRRSESRTLNEEET